MHRLLLTLCSLVFMSSCSQDDGEGLPDLSRPVLIGGGEEALGNTVWEHPWVKRQGKLEYVVAMSDDVEMTRHFHEAMNSERARLGSPEKTFEEDLALIIGEVDRLQAKIPFELPKGYYSVLNLPDLSYGNPGANFRAQLVKRLYLGEGSLGFPIFLDVREVIGGSLEEVVKWHLGTLKGEFKEVKGLPFRAYIGRGDHFENSDITHGMAPLDRGVFFCFYESSGSLFYLFFDAPYQEFERFESTLMKVGLR